jgi:hypothetical protein
VSVRFGFIIVEQRTDEAKQLEAQYAGVDLLHCDLKLVEQARYLPFRGGGGGVGGTKP